MYSFGSINSVIATRNEKRIARDRSIQQQQVTNLMITILKGLKDSSKLFRTLESFASLWTLKSKSSQAETSL